MIAVLSHKSTDHRSAATVWPDPHPSGQFVTVPVNVRKAATVAGTTLHLVASTRPVLLPLTITGLDSVFDISPDLTHALLRAGRGPDG